LKRRVGAIQTDSTPLEAPKDPESCSVFALIRLFATPEDAMRIADSYRAGGFGYGHAKQELIRLIDQSMGEARERRRMLAKDPDTVMDILAEGGRKARRRAEDVMAPVRRAIGLIRSH
jgi:tryptophanyl-tRNA synthetase